MKILIPLTLIALTGCAAMPDAVGTAHTHVSHPFAGPPFGPSSEEDALQTIDLFARWEHGSAFAELSIGYMPVNNGFYGPPITGGFRFGYAIHLHKE